ncbi:hypothetical protein ABZ860_08975 [Microbispora sp. NPDC046973]|uniref:hypothetical protein n=1 Tax=Microbispora sp. NPDC046973 TaxID=3155022 RepID=UPI0033DC8AD4
MATAKDGVLSLAIEKGPTTPRGSQMFDDGVNHFGVENISAIEGKWVPAMPSNLNTFNQMVRGGMPLEEAAANAFTGKMAARHGFTNVQAQNVVGDPGAYTNVLVRFARQGVRWKMLQLTSVSAFTKDAVSLICSAFSQWTNPSS